MRRLINEIVVKCPNEFCKVECTKANLEKHKESCEYEIVFCPNSHTCTDMFRKDLKNHLETACEFRIVECILN